jgi:hypothetical protein
VLRLLRILLGFCAAGVSLLQQSRACWAAETTQQGVTGSVFAGGGAMVDASNEVGDAAYDVYRVGFGLTGVLRFPRATEAPPSASSRLAVPSDMAPLTSRHDPGAFLIGSVADELEWTRLTECGGFCRETTADGSVAPTPGPLKVASKLGLRVGAGYSFSLLEFRLGVLGVKPSSGSAFPDPIWSPDVMLRVGPRNLGWGELGLGAYDASTTLRPGAYVGAGGGKVELVRATGHLGFHLVNGQCCETTWPFGIIAHLDIERALSRSLIAGVDFKWEKASREVFAGGAHLTFLL